MTSTKSQNYPLPIVEKALANNTLYPMEVLEGTRVFVKYPGMVETQTIRLFWRGPKGHGSPVFEELPGSERGIVEFQVSAQTIGACIGKTVHVGYSVVENNQTTPSHELELEVQFLEPIDLPAADLPDRVENNDGDLVMDLHTFAHDPGVALAPWPLMTKGQLLWMEAIGQRNYPSETKLLLLDAYEVNESNVEEGIRLKIPRSWVRSLDNYSAMMIRCYVSFDCDPNSANAHELPHTTCNIRLGEAEAFDDFTDFEHGYWNGWKKGPAVADPRDLVVKHDGTGSFLFNYGYTNPNAGLHLFKDYDYLKPGCNYELSMDLRRNSASNPVPRISLEYNDLDIMEPTYVESRTWVRTGGVFTASSENAQLRLISHVNSVVGNDYDVTRLRLKEV